MNQSTESTKYDVLIVGGGAAGISVAARLRHSDRNLKIAIVDPADKHYYQPLWTLVGGGERPKEITERSMASVIPAGVEHLKDAVSEFLPDTNQVKTAQGRTLGYEQLVVASGIQLDWGKVAGLEGNVGKGGLCSNYSYETVDSTWEAIRAFEGGNAIFTHPDTPIKCGGAPQKIMYLAAEYWEKHPPKGDYKIIFCIASPSIFGVPRYAETLLKVAARHDIDVRYRHDLRAVDAGAKKATFKNLDSDEDVVLDYGMMHVTPPMSAPDFVKASPLVNEGGWVDVDKHTLQHTKYPNVFSLGDSSALPTSKTGAAVRKQAPVAAENLLAFRQGKSLPASYDGYTSCPLVTGYGKLVMAEFDYDGKEKETFPFDQSKERRSMYLLKKYLLPWLYWNKMLKGKM